MTERSFSVSSTKAKPVAQEPVTSVLQDGDVPFDPAHEYNGDEEVLAALGYKAEFKREFTLWSTFCVSFAVLGLLPSFASTLYYGMGYAGTAGMCWGWLIAMVGIQSVACSMAELCSSMPTSGGLYYASACLAPPGWGPFAAWITGCKSSTDTYNHVRFTDYCHRVQLAGSNHRCTFSQLRHCSHDPCGCLNPEPKLRPDELPDLPRQHLSDDRPRLHGFTPDQTHCSSQQLRQHIQRHRSPDRHYHDSSSSEPGRSEPTSLLPVQGSLGRHLHRNRFSSRSWSSHVLCQRNLDNVRFVYLSPSVVSPLTDSGYDAPFHLSEECSNANIAAPRAIFLTSALGGIFGWALQLVVAYTVISIPDVLSSDLGQPFAAYLIQVLPQRIVLAVLALTIIAGFFMGQGCMIAASRVTFAYARDDCFPLSKIWKRVNKTTDTPVNAVWMNCTLGCIMLLLIFGGSLAVGALFSIAAIAAFVAFTTPIFIRVFFVGNRFRPGPWNLGRASIPVGAIASAFVALMVPILCLPSTTGSDLTVETMNWTVLVYGAPMAAILVWWIVDARKWFKGPKVNIEHMHSNAQIVEGLDVGVEVEDESQRASREGEKKMEKM